MLKKLVRQNWPYVLTAIAGTIMFILKFSQGSWQVGMIWLAATAYWLVKLYQKHQVLKNTQK
ncbi:TPA: hypothetical protein U1667_001708 [Streptococcus suis]|uniref:hypothetical protein n=1 Tax=Streptococcus suis TaxID=1307 RepID=UPI00022F95B7|nr:hypothetical protein [Streptococcus suis]AER18108.1 hypothetical protein SSUD9_1946 [Streptococcus suis D9]MBO8053444.1 hypothetical protein [Streptococcus suis]MBS8061071.1 hypothetical protein [Streptococcus suis]MBS8065379.1 hypothetical protein [Streptococcus suis]MBS8088849.1 hypothetical protein [Streptococcus suis]